MQSLHRSHVAKTNKSVAKSNSSRWKNSRSGVLPFSQLSSASHLRCREVRLANGEAVGDSCQSENPSVQAWCVFCLYKDLSQWRQSIKSFDEGNLLAATGKLHMYKLSPAWVHHLSYLFFLSVCVVAKCGLQVDFK